MTIRLAALAAILPLLAACEVTTIEGASPSESAVARTCLGSVAASLKLDRKTLTATAVRSLPEGDEVSISTPTGGVRCYTDLSGKVIAIKQVVLPPEAA